MAFAQYVGRKHSMHRAMGRKMPHGSARLGRKVGRALDLMMTANNQPNDGQGGNNSNDSHKGLDFERKR